jgi:hypothetical protein
LKDVYPAYADKLSFLAVDIDPDETVAMVRDYRTSTGFPWTYAMGDASILQRFRVTQTDIKFGIDGRGIITYQAGYGAEDAQTWKPIFDRLVQP